MIQLGRFNLLPVTEKTAHGFLLGQAPDSVFLPQSEASAQVELGQEVRVFVYRGSAPMAQASMRRPTALLGEFAFLKCIEVSDHGAFMDWGIPKDLFVPFAHQHTPMLAGKRYVVHVGWDNRGERIIGSSKLARYLDYDASELEVGDAVDILVFSLNDAGAQVVVDQRYAGMVYTDATSRRLTFGEEQTGYVARIREDNRLDITLSPPRVHADHRDEAQQIILEALEAADGFLPIHDKSAPADIDKVLGLSKKVFKRSAGGLYKAKKIRIEKDGIYQIGDLDTSE